MFSCMRLFRLLTLLVRVGLHACTHACVLVCARMRSGSYAHDFFLCVHVTASARACLYVRMYVPIHVCMHFSCMHTNMYLRMYVNMYEHICIMQVCTSVCMSACMLACMCVRDHYFRLCMLRSEAPWLFPGHPFLHYKIPQGQLRGHIRRIPVVG